MNLSRRRFLKGAFGATVALPFLESLAPREAFGQSNRWGFLVVMRSGNGVAAALASRNEPELFWPSTAPGPLTRDVLGTMNAQRAVSELAPFAERMILLKGINRPFSTPRCGHAESLPQCLTATRPTEGVSNEPLALGESIDWRIARTLNPAGREPLTLMAGPRSTYIGEGLSWRSARVRESAQRSPLAAYMSLVGLASMPPAAQQELASRRRSVNDLVRGEMQALLGDSALGTSDRQRLQQHFEAIRDTELRMVCTGTPALEASMRAITAPEGNDVRPEVVRRFADVIALAFSCGLTRAATLQIGEGNDQTQYTIRGTRYQRFHWISHRIESDGATGTTIANAHQLHHDIDRLQLQLYRYLLERLDQYPSTYGTGTLLDDCAAVWINDLGNGPPHGGDNVPWLIGGSCAGNLRTGQYLSLNRLTINRVLNTLMAAVGVRNTDGTLIDNFGDASLARGFVDPIMNVTR